MRAQENKIMPEEYIFRDKGPGLEVDTQFVGDRRMTELESDPTL